LFVFQYFFLFYFQITWFTAFMALDQQRIAANRNGIFPCYVHKKRKNNNNNALEPSSPSSDHNSFLFNIKNMEKLLLSIYERLLPTWAFKAVVLAVTAVFLAIGVWGTAVIRQEFDPILLLPPSSYLRQFADRYAVEFPSNGWAADVYTGRLNHTNLAAMEAITAGLQGLVDNRTHLLSIDPWWGPLKRYAARKHNLTHWEDFANPVDFPAVLSDFLFSGEGAAYKANFKWEVGRQLECREPAPPILATKFGITYRLMSGPEEHIPAKRAVEGIIKTATAASGGGDRAFSHVKVYAAWETDEIIGYELLRNVGLGMMCVMIVTMLLLVSLQLSTYVFVCVIATLVDLVGFLHFWGMTIGRATQKEDIKKLLLRSMSPVLVDAAPGFFLLSPAPLLALNKTNTHNKSGTL
jgi:Niemann-Pick C1 protein